MIKNKKGVSTISLTKKISYIFITIVLIIFILPIINIAHSACSQNSVESSFEITETITKITPTFLQKPLKTILNKEITDISIETRLDKRSKQIANILGYGRNDKINICLFYLDLEVGLLAGLWIYILFQIYTMEKFAGRKFFGESEAETKKYWIESLGNSITKIFIIGFGYAVLMQVPFLNAAIDFICFDFLVDGFWFDTIIRSFLIVLYVGIVPTAYSEYKRYKLKRHYQEQVLEKKYQAEAQGAWFRN